MNRKTRAVTASVRQFVTFYIENRLYGIDIQVLKEVNPNTRITPVPRSRECIRGLVNIRGQVVMVVDIAVLFGRDPLAVLPDSQIVIVKTSHELEQTRGLTTRLDPSLFDEKAVGFLVDRIGDVLAVEESRVEECPPHLSEANSKYVEGVVYFDDLPMVILEASEMIRCPIQMKEKGGDG